MLEQGTGASGSAGLVRKSDIAAGHAGGCLRFDGDPAQDLALRGEYRLVRLAGGLTLHATDASGLTDLTTEIELPPRLTCSIVLAGRADFSLGGRIFALGGADEPSVSIVSLARPEVLRRHSPRGSYVRKVNVTLEQEWLDCGGLAGLRDPGPVLRLSREHMAFVGWRPSARLVSLAREVLEGPPCPPVLAGLYLQSRAAEIAFEALAALDPSGRARLAEPLAPAAARSARRVRDFLEARLDETLTLDAAASALGMSVSALQRLFRAAYGTTVLDYVRRRRLERAREALERGWAGIGEAAWRAGYSSPANFATAFKREFGTTPGEACRRHHPGIAAPSRRTGNS
ncbi:helix-turn-helix transcriptional regulator [Arenibaculum pallidiluteum]|uniref:helix-turn-helix transcriptional regulator n=1 Tax=Arenibaculum pallidiluteum TaxID=2812559 RepID=UPI001A976CE7|nr:AraC family transcriptional regulator [Arenibaculum pallidiluteum]